MDRKTLENILDKHKKWLRRETGGERADLHGADLHGADLHGADLHGADLHGADLRGADLHGADLHGADLRDAYLHGADLREADLDYSCWPLWCGSLNTKIDDRIARQFLHHLMRPCLVSPGVSEEFKRALFTPELIEEANAFHRVEKCGWIESPFEEEENHGSCN